MSPSPDRPVSGSPPPHRKVLVVLNEPTLRLGFAYALTNSATAVEAAATGIEALGRLAETRFDLVFLDLRMPGMDGIQVIETLRGTGNRVPVVLCTTLQHPNATWRALNLGVVDFLLKPARPSDIRKVVDFVLNPGRNRLSEALEAARKGNVDSAIRILDAAQDPDPDPVENCWLKSLRRIREVIPAGDIADLEEELRACFPMLAFNGSHDSGPCTG
jgi:CheY-like chemotaxis protein